MRAVYKYWASLVYLVIIVQIGLAGYGAFFVAKEVEGATIDEDKFFEGWDPHALVGYLAILAGLILLILAFVARPGGRYVKWSAILFGLLILQMLLAWFGFEVPAIGFFHPINAVALAGVSGWLAWELWKADRAVAEPAPTTAV
jgi:Family of unknown function (DUF6220)